eukprot:2727718-Amphidinium_carterae.1
MAKVATCNENFELFSAPVADWRRLHIFRTASRKTAPKPMARFPKDHPQHCQPGRWKSVSTKGKVSSEAQDLEDKGYGVSGACSQLPRELTNSKSLRLLYSTSSKRDVILVSRKSLSCIS